NLWPSPFCSGLLFDDDHLSAADARVVVPAARTVAHLLDTNPAPAPFVRARQEDSPLKLRHSSPLLPLYPASTIPAQAPSRFPVRFHLGVGRLPNISSSRSGPDS